MSYRILLGDARDVLATLPAGSARTCICSPPYFGLRDYGTAAWDGGHEDCDHKRITSAKIEALTRSSTIGKNTAAGRDQMDAWAAGSFGYRDVCGKCGARRVDRQIGLEASISDYLAALVAVFAEVRRVLTDDGTLWLNMGDSYGAGGRTSQVGQTFAGGALRDIPSSGRVSGFSKQLLGVPWRLAFALQDAGWTLRSDIIWHKKSPMPESVRDRPTKSHEYIFLLAKRPRYFWDAEAVREGFADDRMGNPGAYRSATAEALRSDEGRGRRYLNIGKPWNEGGGATGRNVRSVWSFPSEPFPGSHFATMPSALAARCIKAGTSERGRCPACSAPWVREVEREVTGRGLTASELQDGLHGRCSALSLAQKRQAYRGLGLEGPPPPITTGWRPTCGHGLEPVPDVVLDPFAGAGTTLLAADRLHRDSVGIELNPEYREMALKRIASDEDLPLFAPPEPAPPRPRPAWDGSGPLPGQLDLFAEDGP